MKLYLKHISLLLLVLVLSLLAERAIPHSHVEKGDIVVPDFMTGDDHGTNDEDSGEEIHSSYFQDADFNCSFDLFYLICILGTDYSEKIAKQVFVRDFEILSKILNARLFVVHTFSSKSPPYFK